METYYVGGLFVPGVKYLELDFKVGIINYQAYVSSNSDKSIVPYPIFEEWRYLTDIKINQKGPSFTLFDLYGNHQYEQIYPCASLELNFGCANFETEFVVVKNACKPMLGLDFQKKNGLCMVHTGNNGRNSKWVFQTENSPNVLKLKEKIMKTPTEY